MGTTDLFYANLALDSYYRGLDPGIAGLGGPGSKIGSAKMLNIPVPPGLEEAGFYAAAYRGTAGNIVISYRGTDTIFSGDDAACGGGGGYQSEQAELAEEQGSAT